MAIKFKLQDPDDPKRTCRTNPDDDRSTCCGACLMYFERDYDESNLGAYVGCEVCGAYSTNEN